jgi:NAD-dependent SIR2 family protein deacetylase
MKPAMSAFNDEHTVEDLVLFAITSGELYGKHRALAASEQVLGRAEANARWVRHIRGTVEPLYNRQCTERADWSASTVCKAAERLQAYYAAHASE